MNFSETQSPYLQPSQPKSKNIFLGVAGVILIVSIVIILKSFNNTPATTPAATTPAATTPPASNCCPPNYIKDGLFCREACPENYKLVGALCIQQCPVGYIDQNGFCTKLPDIYSKGCCCNLVTRECCNNCKEGYNDILCNCQHTGSSFMKSIYPAKTIPISTTSC